MTLRPKLASAQEVDLLHVDASVDGAVTASALAGTLLLMLVPVDRESRWKDELFLSWDESVQDNFSTNAADLSDAMLAASIATPLLLQVRNGFDEDAGQRVLVYGETLATSLLVNSVTKYAVQRPRPYVYNRDPKVQAYVAAQGDDAYLSFFSGHASTAFSGAVAGSYLFAQESDSTAAKSAVWSIELGLASATAILRVRAGKHYYSDVVVGLLVGSGIGVLVPALHSEAGVYKPSGTEWASMAAGLAVGAAFGQWVPLGDEDPTASGRDSLVHGLQVSPLATQSGGGLSLSGLF
jgi:membrane-associated phospholipid phosphatase